jgi:uncharacterized protein YyaL (SSP411 family)
VLQGIRQNFEANRAQVDEQARNVTEHLVNANAFGIKPTGISIPFEEKFTTTQLDLAFENIMGQADRVWGGFGRAPKFPQTFTIQYLLRYAHFTGNKEALDQALLSLDKMIMGGIYDHVGGGFARYSTDTEWLAPHFEKMLYDNALLVLVLCEANQITGKPIYAKVIRETLAFVERELMNEEFAFYSALDADSEGVEGKFYTWSKKEVKDILGEDATWFCDVFDITEEGNWEHTNIPRLRHWPAEILAGPERAKIETCLRKMLATREKRIRPLLDDKVLLGWNALMNSAFSAAFAALGDLHYREIAEKNMNFLFTSMADGLTGKAKHTYKNGVARVDAFLDDYACLITALLRLQEITGNCDYSDRAVVCSEYILDGFTDEEGLFFYYTHKDQDDVILRKKEIYDGAVPSGNAVMAYNLLCLSILYNKTVWKDRAVALTDAVSQMAVRYPTSFGNWLNLLQEWVRGTWEIVIMGKEAERAGREVLEKYIPCKVMQYSTIENERYPLLAGKKLTERTTLFLCRNYSCKNPVYNTGDLVQLIESETRSSGRRAQ